MNLTGRRNTKMTNGGLAQQPKSSVPIRPVSTNTLNPGTIPRVQSWKMATDGVNWQAMIRLEKTIDKTYQQDKILFVATKLDAANSETSLRFRRRPTLTLTVLRHLLEAVMIEMTLNFNENAKNSMICCFKTMNLTGRRNTKMTTIRKECGNTLYSTLTTTAWSPYSLV